ncbi:MAG: hypothetical protein ACI9E5_001477 [Candidatus Omnitrophota bacterium]|jgi:hypothetical protein
MEEPMLSNIYNFLNRVKVSFCWEIIQRSSVKIETSSNDLPDLCPSDEAIKVEPYIDRLNELLVNRSKKVREIAITAPYSGGKSSFIHTFIKRYPFYNYTQISLASFQDRKNNEETESEHLNTIEKGIVQQILYRTESKKTPNSRFRRIYPAPISRAYTMMTSCATVIWTSILLIGINSNVFKSSITFDMTSNDQNIYFYGLVLFFIGFPVLVLSKIIGASHRFNILKLNPLKGEIALEKKDTDSVFNLYLEEIIYYFSTTKSDVVIFEDLDRFEMPEIFIKLKELNKLINDSNDVKKSVRFIYALRDNVFKGKDRTKFFDSIIPIIPIANKANSYPQLKTLLKNAGFGKNLSDAFLRDAAVYVDDMRILKNIVVEYKIYKDTLQPSLGTLDLDKLFAFIIYKNMYCDDFAKLHEGEGELSTIFNAITALKHEKEKDITSKIKELEMTVNLSNKELTQSLEEINSYYVLHVMKKVNHQSISHINNNTIFDIIKPSVFDSELENENNMNIKYQGGHQNQISWKFNHWVNDLDPTYAIRKGRIINKGLSQREEILNSIKTLKFDLDSIKKLSFKELCKVTEKGGIFNGGKGTKLLRHLVEKGYIDEHYHVYITHFIEGHMTKSDMDFVMSVRSNKTLDPSTPINDCSETYKYLSADEFKSVGFFNFDIFNHLLDNKISAPLKQFIKYVTKENSNSIDYIKKSFLYINDKVLWLELLNNEWEGLWSEVVNCPTIDEDTRCGILVSMLAELTEKDQAFHQLDGSIEIIGDYINENEKIANYLPIKRREKFFKALKYMGVRIKSLSGCKKEHVFIEHAVKHQVLDINKNNIITAMSTIGKEHKSIQLDISEILLIKNNEFSIFISENIADVATLISENKISVNNERDAVNLLNNTGVP